MRKSYLLCFAIASPIIIAAIKTMADPTEIPMIAPALSDSGDVSLETADKKGIFNTLLSKQLSTFMSRFYQISQTLCFRVRQGRHCFYSFKFSFQHFSFNSTQNTLSSFTPVSEEDLL